MLRGCLQRYSHPFGMVLPKGGSWFDKLTTNGLRGLRKHPLRSAMDLLPLPRSTNENLGESK